MLAVVPRACSIVDSIAIYVGTRRACLPRQCQPLSGRGCGNRPGACRRLGSQRCSRRGPRGPKEESAAEQQCRGESGTGQKSCITMEVIVNAVMSSTDRAWTGFEINPSRNASKAHPFDGKRVVKCLVLVEVVFARSRFPTCLVASHV